MKIFKRVLATAMTVIMLLTALPFAGIDFDSIFASKASAKAIKECSVGDIVEFGSYPQSKVTDSATLTALNNISKSWVSYGYYSGTGSNSDGQMKPSDYMKYCDISYNENRYRAVKFSSYRPNFTGYTSSLSNTSQNINGYYTGNTYYFKYESLTWRVLDPSEGFVMCTTAIDAQAYNNYIIYNNSNHESYGDSAQTHYASDWENSSLRAWLNDDFYNTAFTSTEKSQIDTTYNENKSTYSSKYDGANTSDKIFVLSYDEVLNSKYGFSSDEDESTTRQLKSTDYAKCQGCYQFTNSSTRYYGNCTWSLRSPAYSDGYASVVEDGYVYDYYTIGNSTSSGVVPAFKFNSEFIICDTHNYSSAVTLQPTCTTDGVRTYTCSNCGDTYTETIDKLGHNFGAYTVTTPATCTAKGVETRNCSRCTATETREIEAKGHSYTTAVTNPTCTEQGYTTHTCSCGDSYVDTYVNALGHNFGEWKVTTPPTTQKTGVETRYCSRCTATETRTLDKLPTISLKLQDSLSLNYKSSAQINTLIYNPEEIKCSISYKSSDPKIATVDENGNVTAVKRGKGSATITCTVTDEFGNVATDTCTVNISLSLTQKFIVYVLFGWIWY